MPNAIEVRGLIKQYGSLAAVDGIDLEVATGECFGLLGPNGAGKTTTVEILEGLLEPTAGSVTVLGRTWSGNSIELRDRIGVALQETHLADRLTVREILILFRSFHGRGVGVDEVIERVELGEKADTWVMKLSGGQRQRLAVACALVGDPDLLFLDEPTTGLDPHSRRRLWDVVSNFRNRGKTVVLTTHYMEEAEHLCDRVAVVDRGRVIALGSPAELIDRLGGPEVIEFTSVPLPGMDLFDGLAGLQSARILAGTWTLSVTAVHEVLPPLLDRLRDRGVTLTRLGTHRATLEDVFVALTGRTLLPDAETGAEA